MQTEAAHLAVLYAQLKQDIAALQTQLATIGETGRQMKKDLAAEGHLDLSSYSETLESFASIEANNRQIDALNARYHSAALRLAHARLLLPQGYFAKLTLDYGDGDPEAVYLGKVGYADADANDLVYDWRAPVADAYYANRIGATTYPANGRDIAVLVVGREQFVIEHDRLVHAVQTKAAIGDPLLLATLAQDRSGGLQEITATIQQAQNAIIREHTHPVVIVDGVAGSGKTSVMLQRVAYQLYQHRGEWTPENILILTPNVAFGRYIRGVLPALGEAEPMSVTYARFVQQLAQRFGLTVDVSDDAQLPAVAAAMQRPLADAPVGVPASAYGQSASTAPFVVRMQRVWRWLAATKQLPEDFATWLDWDALAAQWQLPPLSAYAKLYVLLGITDYHQDTVAALYVDEAQDYPAASWLVLAQVFAKAAVTIVGDHRQRLSGEAVDYAAFFAARHPRQLALTTSYRATGAITQTFAAYAGDWAIAAVQPMGPKPRHGAAGDWPKLLAEIPATAKQSIAVIAPDAATAAAVHAELKAGQLLAADAHATVVPGLNVMSLATAKGLEFDHVVVVGWQTPYYQDATYGDNRRYVAASRGTKTLTLID